MVKGPAAERFEKLYAAYVTEEERTAVIAD